MKFKETSKKIVDGLVCLLLTLVLSIGCFFITGCPEAEQMMGPVITEPSDTTEEPAEQPAEPTTTVGNEKQDPVTEPEPETPVDETEKPVETPEEPAVTDTQEPVSTVTLPPGYELPPELIPDTPPVLSDNEAALMEAEKKVKRAYPDIESDIAPTLQTQAGYTADLISLLPHGEREEVYGLFVASVDLPFFAEASEKMKEVNIRLVDLNGKALESGDWGPYDTYRHKVEVELGIHNITSRRLEDIYFQENPDEIQYSDGNYRYWMILEWYRLQLQHPEIDLTVDLLKMENLYRKSCANGMVFGLDNPWV